MIISDLKILICDDSVLVRKKLGEMLKSMGCGKTLDAANGQEAIDMYKEHKPDLLLMDIVMPVKTGIEAIKEIIAYDSNAKIIIASSVGTQKNLKSAIEAGAYDFIQKPISEDTLIKVLEKIARDGE